MSKAHHPVIVQRSDGRWELHCADCSEARDATVPIGVGLPLATRDVAELLRENHLRPFAGAS